MAIHWRVQLGDPCGFFPTKNILWFCDSAIIQHITLKDCKTHDKLFQHSFDSVTWDGEVWGYVRLK